jgi:hypothetical protein
MSASMASRPTPTDSTPVRSANADGAEKKASRPDPKAADPVEPHWDLVIAAATD